MKHINLSAPVKARHSIEISASLEQIWRILTGIENWPSWNSAISRAYLEGPLASGTIFRWKSGPSKITSMIHICSKHKEFGWTGRGMGITAIHNWHMEEKNGDVLVTTEESMEGFLARLLPGTLQKQLDKGLPEWLEELKKAAETTKNLSY